MQGEKARLNDALMRAISLLEKRPRTERRIIVAISDGFDSGSETGDDEVVRRATGAETTIYGLGFNPVRLLLDAKPKTPPPDPLDTNVARPAPPGTVPTPSRSEGTYGASIPVVDILAGTGKIIQSAVASSALEFYAGYTGGAFFSHWKKKTLEEQLSRMAAEINSQYEVAYVPATLSQPGFHRIEVHVRRPGVKAGSTSRSGLDELLVRLFRGGRRMRIRQHQDGTALVVFVTLNFNAPSGFQVDFGEIRSHGAGRNAENHDVGQFIVLEDHGEIAVASSSQQGSDKVGLDLPLEFHLADFPAHVIAVLHQANGGEGGGDRPGGTPERQAGRCQFEIPFAPLGNALGPGGVFELRLDAFLPSIDDRRRSEQQGGRQQSLPHLSQPWSLHHTESQILPHAGPAGPNTSSYLKMLGISSGVVPCRGAVSGAAALRSGRAAGGNPAFHRNIHFKVPRDGE